MSDAREKVARWLCRQQYGDPTEHLMGWEEMWNRYPSTRNLFTGLADDLLAMLHPPVGEVVAWIAEDAYGKRMETCVNTPDANPDEFKEYWREQAGIDATVYVVRPLTYAILAEGGEE